MPLRSARDLPTICRRFLCRRYNGLVGIGIVLEDPFGTDAADLPALAFQSAMKAECLGFASAIDAIDHKGWWPGFRFDKGA